MGQLKTVADVLLLEPFADSAARLRRPLARAGCHITRVGSSQEAERYLEQHTVQLVLINAELPRESAWLWGSKIRLRHTTLRLWFYADRISNHSRQYAKFVGAEQFVTDADPEQIGERVAELILEHVVLEPVASE